MIDSNWFVFVFLLFPWFAFLYPSNRASIFDHSCVPNASFCFVGTTIYIKAIKEIKGDYNRIRICYIDELETTEDRIRQLFSLYYFICDCERCVSFFYIFPRFTLYTGWYKNSNMLFVKLNISRKSVEKRLKYRSR